MATIPLASDGTGSGLVYGGTSCPWTPPLLFLGRGNGSRAAPSQGFSPCWTHGASRRCLLRCRLRERLSAPSATSSSLSRRRRRSRSRDDLFFSFLLGALSRAVEALSIVSSEAFSVQVSGARSLDGLGFAFSVGASTASTLLFFSGTSFSSPMGSCLISFVPLSPPVGRSGPQQLNALSLKGSRSLLRVQEVVHPAQGQAKDTRAIFKLVCHMPAAQSREAADSNRKGDRL